MSYSNILYMSCKQLRSIKGSLKVEVAKKVELEEHIAKER